MPKNVTLKTDALEILFTYTHIKLHVFTLVGTVEFYNTTQNIYNTFRKHKK